jgi:hypothetical protein
MAHFAQLDENNVVTQVIVVANQDAPDEKTGQEFIASIGLTGAWKQTSYNTYKGVHLSGGTPLRKNFAGIGFTYDVEKDAFIPPMPLKGYILNEETCQWEAPFLPDLSDETLDWKWNEDLLSWESFTKTPE